MQSLFEVTINLFVKETWLLAMCHENVTTIFSKINVALVHTSTMRKPRASLEYSSRISLTANETRPTVYNLTSNKIKTICCREPVTTLHPEYKRKLKFSQQSSSHKYFCIINCPACITRCSDSNIFIIAKHILSMIWRTLP